jgi:hypothetical protein
MVKQVMIKGKLAYFDGSRESAEKIQDEFNGIQIRHLDFADKYFLRLPYNKLAHSPCYLLENGRTIDIIQPEEMPDMIKKESFYLHKKTKKGA